jgi:4-methylaminobutanoate oxidase (formaldehyde-forming)
MGPKARELLGRVSPDDLSPEALKFAHTREIDLGHARVRAARMSYVGGPGFELYVPVEMARHVYLALKEAGADLGLADAAGRKRGLVDAGYYAIDALRIEAGRRAWGAELGPDESPFEAGLMFAVKLDKGGDFIGREALLRLRDQPLNKKLLSFVFDSPQAYAWGGDAVSIDGEAVGELSSAGWSPKAGACVGLGYVRGEAARRTHRGTQVLINLYAGVAQATAWDL